MSARAALSEPQTGFCDFFSEITKTATPHDGACLIKIKDISPVIVSDTPLV